MVSSTYYDLRQVRQDLAGFIDHELGYNILLSEFNSFPIDPDKDTIENCRRRVERDADILILIIGSRYGYVEEKSNKSVTNLEYLTARAKGIPIYAFVDKSIIPLLSVWEQNPEARFDSVVTNTKVFEFIHQVRSLDRVWTHEFENAQTIIQTLRLQFAHLMHEGLQATKRLATNRAIIPSGISGKALRLVLEKPEFWEYCLFGQVLTDEVDKYSELREEHRLELLFSQGEAITSQTIFDWLDTKTAEMIRLVSTSEKIVNKHLKTALGPPGMPGNPEALAFTAKKLGEVYQQALGWAKGVRHTYVRPCLQPVIDYMVIAVDDLIEKVGDWGPIILKEIDRARLLPEGAQAEISITLNIDTAIGADIVDVLQQCLENCKDE